MDGQSVSESLDSADLSGGSRADPLEDRPTMRIHRLVLVTALLTIFALAGSGREALASEEGEGGEAHEGLEFSHPLFSNTPQPERVLRFYYDYFNEPSHGDEPGADRHTWTVGAEYALLRSFSLELLVPWTYLHPDEHASTSRLDDLELVGKYASFAFEEQGVLFGGGLALDLPTGDEDKDIGSSHIVVIEPFLDFGYKLNRFELIGFANFGFPVNEGHEDEADLELSWNLSFLYLITDRFHYMLEFDGKHLFGGEHDGFDMVNISPGVKYQVLKNRKLYLGASVRLPLASDKQFYVSPRFSVFYHF
jgi:hypothetical protein